MSSPKATAYLRGISASPGLARGPLVRLQEGVRTGYEHRQAGQMILGACDPPSMRRAPSSPR